MEDLPLGKIGALVPEFAVKDLPLGRTLMMIWSLFFDQFVFKMLLDKLPKRNIRVSLYVYFITKSLA